MDKINFEPIGEAMTAFDTDKMNIGRRVPTENPDGTSGETMPNVPLYENIACHLSFNQVDNPNYNSDDDTRPIIQLITISCNRDVDLQNGDYITAFKLANNGDVLETYRGVIGQPTTSMSRQTAQMEIRTDI